MINLVLKYILSVLSNFRSFKYFLEDFVCVLGVLKKLLNSLGVPYLSEAFEMASSGYNLFSNDSEGF